MNILYISALEGGKYSGPLYSVPQQILAQAEIDNVYWVNMTRISTASRFDSELYHYLNLKDFKIVNLPKPFNKPDLIIFEEFYKIQCCLIARQAVRNNIPYIIIPRCQMTEKYLENKKLKKKIASFLLFKHFANKAISIQFLSNQEREDSKGYYKGNCFIAPNGINESTHKKIKTSRDFIVGVFIGRYSIWQKGLDILIEAISKKKEELRDSYVSIHLYGPDERTGSKFEIENLVSRYGVSEIVHVNGPVFDEQKNDILINSDFFIHTSRFEGMPMSVLEALSYGIPCLVSQGSNLREVVDDYDAGWGVDNSIDGIINGIERIIHDLNNLSEKGSNAKHLANKYSWKNIAYDCHEYFVELLSK